jgi:predicted RNA-binding Zn-ribbon protein involved in translation (DUF1610 family)
MFPNSGYYLHQALLLKRPKLTKWCCPQCGSERAYKNWKKNMFCPDCREEVVRFDEL